MTINNTNIDNYLLQQIDTGFEYRNGDEGYTANGMHYQNIIAKKALLTLKFRPLNLVEYQTIKNLFESTDEYEVIADINGITATFNCYRDKDFKGTNVGNMFIKNIVVQLKEI